MFLSESCSLRRQVTFPKVENVLENKPNFEEDQIILNILNDLGKIEMIYDAILKYSIMFEVNF